MDYADLAATCRDLGYPAFNLHGWDGDWRDPDLLEAAVHAVGERVGDELDLIAAEATDFVRADPEYDGGIAGAMKRARIAEGFGLDVEFHALGPAQRHCIGATRNTNYYEMALVHPIAENTTPPVYDGDYTDDLDTIDEDGCLSVPDGPGLGVEYDWDYVEANATGRREYT